MSRRKRRKSRNYNRSDNKRIIGNNLKRTRVTVAVPASVARWMPRTMVVPAINQINHTKRHRRVRLKKSRKTVKRSVILYVPPSKPRPAAMMVKGQGLTIFSQRRVNRILRDEKNRKRYDEEKDFRRRRSSGHLDSVRNDRFGIIGSNSRRSARNIADSAMVARALEEIYRRR